MDPEQQRSMTNSDGRVTYALNSYRRFVVFGLLALTLILLPPFISLNRNYLSGPSTSQDVGLTIILDLPIGEFRIPTAQFIVCALAVVIPSLAILCAYYTDFTSGYLFRPNWLERLLWSVGTTGMFLVLMATFYYISPASSVIFFAFLVVFLVLYVISSFSKNRLARRERK